MRLSFRFLFILIPVLLVVVFAFNRLMHRFERQWTLRELQDRAQLVFDSIQDPILESVSGGKLSGLLRIYERIKRDPNLMGVRVCTFKGHTISKSPGFPKDFGCDWKPVEAASDELAKIESGFVQTEGNGFAHKAIFLLKDEEGTPRAYVLFVHNTNYQEERSELARKYTIYAFLGLGILISLITMLVYRWSVSRPIEQLGEVMKGVLTGDAEKITKALEGSEFAPLVTDLDEILTSFRGSKGNGKSESTSGSNLWNPERLSDEVKRLFEDSRICVIANEEPYIHNRKGGQIETVVPASGLVTALEPVMRACSGVWIGRGVGNADFRTADKHGILLVPSDNPQYALKRVWLSRNEEQGFFFGFSNEGLWPLCHIAHERPHFRKKDWETYVEVNAKFATSFNEESQKSRPIVLVQDYHFALVPEMIRKMRPDAMVSLFWHVPWPSPESFQICPWRKDLLMGMLGADLIGFQLQEHCNNFLSTIERMLEAQVSRENFSVTIQGHTCFVKPFPISVEWPAPYPVSREDVPKVKKEVLDEFSLNPDMVIGLGVDRLDYTKGIIERFLAVEKLLEDHPELVGKFVFVQMLSPTNRMHLKRYQELNSEIQNVADRINWKFHTDEYQPILLNIRHHSKKDLFRYYRAADFCYVSSIHDGMGLVAKEFVSSRSDLGGVLVLSQFAGSSKDLKDALIVNPYDLQDSAEALYKAIEMSPTEKAERMARLRAVVANGNVFFWASRLLRELASVSKGQFDGDVEKSFTEEA